MSKHLRRQNTSRRNFEHGNNDIRSENRTSRPNIFNGRTHFAGTSSMATMTFARKTGHHVQTSSTAEHISPELRAWHEWHSLAKQDITSTPLRRQNTSRRNFEHGNNDIRSENRTSCPNIFDGRTHLAGTSSMATMTFARKTGHRVQTFSTAEHISPELRAWQQ